MFLLDAPPEARIAFDSRIEERVKLNTMRTQYNGNIELAIDQLIENTNNF